MRALSLTLQTRLMHINDPRGTSLGSDAGHMLAACYKPRHMSSAHHLAAQGYIKSSTRSMNQIQHFTGSRTATSQGANFPTVAWRLWYDLWTGWAWS